MENGKRERGSRIAVYETIGTNKQTSVSAAPRDFRILHPRFSWQAIVLGRLWSLAIRERALLVQVDLNLRKWPGERGWFWYSTFEIVVDADSDSAFWKSNWSILTFLLTVSFVYFRCERVSRNVCPNSVRFGILQTIISVSLVEWNFKSSLLRQFDTFFL